MSEQETVVGKLMLLPKLENETLEEQCRRIYNEKIGPREEYEWRSWEDDLFSDGYKDFVVYGGNVYEVIEKKDVDDHDIFEMSDNNDGTYSFTLSYYNGGCSFNEAIEEAFKNMEGK